MLTALLDALLIVLAVIGALFGAAMLVATAAYFIVRGVRASRRVRDGDEEDELWI